MSINKTSNLFSEEELLYFHKMTDSLKIPLNKDGSCVYEEDSGFSISKDLGRLQFTIKDVPDKIKLKLEKIAKSFVDYTPSISECTYVEYNSKYGKPVLPVHFDGDRSDLIINYQFLSNTSWGVGLNLNVYELEDNSALIFNPNTQAHWRPHKIFKDQEFVKMLFFRFQNLKDPSDYSQLSQHWPKDEIFKEINDFRNSLDIL